MVVRDDDLSLAYEDVALLAQKCSYHSASPLFNGDSKATQGFTIQEVTGFVEDANLTIVRFSDTGASS